MNAEILEDIRVERNRQDTKWGIQTHLDVHPEAKDGYDACMWAGISTEATAKSFCEDSVRDGTTNWTCILAEELSESVNAAGEGDLPHAREELVQVAAVAAAWIEDIDRRLKESNGQTSPEVGSL